MAVPRAGWQRWVVALAAALAVAAAAWRLLWHGDTVRKAKKKARGGGKTPGKGKGQGRVTVFNSYPKPGSREGKDYSGDKYRGQFSGIKGKKSQKWVAQHNIVAVHEKDFPGLRGKWVRIKTKGGKTIDARVVDECSDKDCSGCCTRNSGGKNGFLLDLEASTAKRAGVKNGGGGVASYQVIDKPDPKYLMGTSAKF